MSAPRQLPERTPPPAGHDHGRALRHGSRLDSYVDRYAERTLGMTASQIRSLFAVASRPEVVSLAGGMPGFEGQLTELEIAQVTLYERVEFGGLDVETAETACGFGTEEG